MAPCNTPNVLDDRTDLLEEYKRREISTPRLKRGMWALDGLKPRFGRGVLSFG